MATYKSKKYNGNLVETLEKFQKKFPGKKIVKVTESEEGGLSITTDDGEREPEHSVSEAGNQKWMGDTKCDFCHKECGNTLYDGKTDMGPWAVMCDMCFHDHGVGLGTGMGQQYKKVGSDYVKVPDKKKPAGRKSVDDDTARMFRGMLGW